MAEDLRLPGYRLERRDARADGEVWLARTAQGERVTLRLLAASDDLAEQDRVRRRLAALTSFEHPHVARLRTVVTTPHGPVLVHDWVGGDCLADVLAAGDGLSPGQLVTLAAPLAEALAALHAAGAGHGGVSMRSVVLSADGRPLLLELGAGNVAGGATPADDVAALAGLCLLAGGAGSGGSARALAVPGQLGELLAAAADSDPARRPTANALAAGLLAACPAEPLRSAAPPAYQPAGGDDPPAQDRENRSVSATHLFPRSRGSGARRADPLVACRRSRAASRHRAPQRAGVLVTLPVLVLLAAGAGVVWAEVAQEPQSRQVRAIGPQGGGAATSQPASSASPPGWSEPPRSTPATPGRAQEEPPRDGAAGSWANVLDELDRRRAAAFATGDSAALRSVYRPGSAPLTRDLQRLRALSIAGARAEDLRLELVSVRRLREGPHGVVLHVVDRLRPHTLVSTDGTVLARRPGRGEVAWLVRLHRAGAQGWRIAGVARASAEQRVRPRS